MIDQTVTVKGSPVRSLQKFIEASLTPAQMAQVFAALPPEYSRLQRPVLATESIPVHMLNRLTEESARVRGEALEEFARRAGREAAGEAVKGVYRFFARVLTPTALLGKASHMWHSLYNRGELQVESETDKSAVIALVNFPSEIAGCSRITGWIEQMAELTGARQVQAEQVECAARGGKVCRWKVSWK